MKSIFQFTKRQSALPGVVAGASTIACVVVLAGSLWGQSSPWVGSSDGAIYYNSGNVGIGSTNPAATLDVAGTIATSAGGGSSLFDVTNRYPSVGLNDYGASYLSGVAGYGGLWQLDITSGNLIYYSGLNAAAGAPHSHVALMAINQNGSAGIGTANPSDKLEVLGGNGSYVKSTATQSGANNWAGFQIKSWVSSAPDTWSLQGGSLNGGGVSTFAIANNNSAKFLIDNNGNVGIGIGSNSPRPYMLSVNGTIGTREVVVTGTGWSDYVFNPDYLLTPLPEVANYIKAHHHLPDIPSASEVQEKGVSMGEMQAKLLAKVEELTLHMIRAEERSNRLQQENRELGERLRRLESTSVSQAEIAEAPAIRSDIR